MGDAYRIRLPKRLPDGTCEVQRAGGPVETVPCEVWDTGVAGLVAHRPILQDGVRGVWELALASSARSIGAVCVCLGHAVMVARHLRGLLDWTADPDAIVAEHREKRLVNLIPTEAMLCAIRRIKLARACRTPAEALRWQMWRRRTVAAFMADHNAGRKEPSAAAVAAVRWGYPGRGTGGEANA